MLNRRFCLKRSFFVWASAISTMCVLLILALDYTVGDAMESPVSAARFKRLFSDFFEVLRFSASASPYEQCKTSYPPLAVLLFKPLGILCGAAEKATHSEFLVSPLCVTVYLIYFLSSVALICAVFRRLLKKADDKSAHLHACLFFVLSGGVMYTFFRGNIIITALLFTLLFLALKDSKNPFLRELSLIFLAMAGAIKLYPLIFGAFLLSKKRYFDSARVAVYFFALFTLPLLAFEGGFGNFKFFLANMGTFQYGENRLLQLANMSVSGLVAKIFGLFEQTPRLIRLTGAISLTLMLLVLALCIFVAVFTKNDFRRALACAAAVCVVPAVSYYYAIIFMAIPLIFYMTDPCIKCTDESPTLKDVLLGKESMPQLCDVVFWCSVWMISMAVQVPLRFAMSSSLYLILIVLALTFHELFGVLGRPGHVFKK